MQVVKLSQVYRLKKGRWYRRPRWEKAHLTLAFTGIGRNRRYHILVYSEDVHASPKYRIPLSEVASELKIGPATIHYGSPSPRTKTLLSEGVTKKNSVHSMSHRKSTRFLSVDLDDRGYDVKLEEEDKPMSYSARDPPMIPLETPSSHLDLMLSIPIRCPTRGCIEIAWILLPSEKEFAEWKRLIAGKLAEIGLKPPKQHSIASSVSTSASSSTPSSVGTKDDQESVSSEWESFWDAGLTP